MTHAECGCILLNEEVWQRVGLGCTRSLFSSTSPDPSRIVSCQLTSPYWIVYFQQYFVDTLWIGRILQSLAILTWYQLGRVGGKDESGFDTKGSERGLLRKCRLEICVEATFSLRRRASSILILAYCFSVWCCNYTNLS